VNMLKQTLDIFCKKSTIKIKNKTGNICLCLTSIYKEIVTMNVGFNYHLLEFIPTLEN